MNAPDNIDSFVTAIYRRFKDWNKRGFSADDVTWCEVKADIAAIIGINAAVEAERNELRKEVERLKAEVIEADGYAEMYRSNGETYLETIDQLRARLDAAMEWQPVAEAELKNSEPVIAWQNGGDWREAIHFHGRLFYPGSDEEICGMTHIMRIKLPANVEEKP